MTLFVRIRIHFSDHYSAPKRIFSTSLIRGIETWPGKSCGESQFTGKVLGNFSWWGKSCTFQELLLLARLFYYFYYLGRTAVWSGNLSLTLLVEKVFRIIFILNLRHELRTKNIYKIYIGSVHFAFLVHLSATSVVIYCEWSFLSGNRLLPLLVHPSGTVFRTLSAVRTTPKLLSGTG